jgi:hypothetical protein
MLRNIVINCVKNNRGDETFRVAKTDNFAILHPVTIVSVVMLLCVPSDIDKVQCAAVIIT